jgi:hypothetical protein
MKNRITNKGRIKKGRGQGTGSSYSPWIKVHDFSSKGLVTRIYSLITGRIHHLLSLLELKVFYFLEFQEPKNIYEQYSLLPLSETIEIAALAGLRHPQMNGQEVVMSIDFLVEFDDSSVGVCVRPSNRIPSSALAKFEIERQFLERRSIPYKIVSEKQLPPGKYLENIVLARQSAKRPDVITPDNEFLSDLKCISDGSNLSVSDSLKTLATQYSCPYPNLKNLFFHLIWKKRIGFDLSSKNAMDLKFNEYGITA